MAVWVQLPRLDTLLLAGLSVGTKQIFDRDTVAAMLAVEQPLLKTRYGEVDVIADWFSGTHGFAFLTPGLQYKWKDALTFDVGYQIPNTPRSGRPGLVLQMQLKH